VSFAGVPFAQSRLVGKHAEVAFFFFFSCAIIAHIEAISNRVL
jgi:hypothetical protein